MIEISGRINTTETETTMDISIGEFVMTLIAFTVLGFFIGMVAAMAIDQRSKRQFKDKLAAEAEVARQNAHTEAVKEHTEELRRANAISKINGTVVDTRDPVGKVL